MQMIVPRDIFLPFGGKLDEQSLDSTCKDDTAVSCRTAHNESFAGEDNLKGISSAPPTYICREVGQGGNQVENPDEENRLDQFGCRCSDLHIYAIISLF